MLIPITAAARHPVSREEAKEYLRIDESEDEFDNSIDIALASAVAYVESHTNLILSDRSFELRSDCWPSSSIDINVVPVRDVEALSYLDAAGNEQTVDDDDWFWFLTDGGASVCLVQNFSRPALQAFRPGTVRIRLSAGYDDPNSSGSGDDPALQLPPQARQAILMLTSHFFENRGAASEKVMTKIPLGVDRLLDQVKVYR